MNRYVIVGAGPIGSAVARQLIARGDRAVVVTRSGTGPEGAECIALDATDADALTEVTRGATALFNCANPLYHRWAIDWPPLASSMLAAAEATGAVLVITSNLYGYGPVDGVMTPDLPLAATGTKGKVRAQMWREAQDAHEAGRIRAVEVRGSDYVGVGAQSHIERALPAVLAGKKAKVIGNPDMPHSWTYTEDMAATLVSAADNPQAWGRAWHAPSAAVRTQREALADLAGVAGVAAPKVAPMPGWQLKVAGVFVPMVRELDEVSYQFAAPFVVDDSETRDLLGVTATDWSTVLTRSAEAAQTAA